MPMLASDNTAAGQGHRRPAPGDRNALLAVIGIHVAAALAHIFVYRDRVMQRMLPG